MTSVYARPVENSSPEELEARWAEIRTELEQQKEAIRTEIANYPPPIAGCDAQFNYLLEERTRVNRALNRLNRLYKESLSSDNPSHFLEQFPIQGS
jgi:chromosome segregation ATPase